MKSGDWIIFGLLAVIAVTGAVYDLRTKTVPRWLLATGGLLLAIAVALCHISFAATGTVLAVGIPFVQRVFGLVPGLVLVVISARWKTMGIGDAVLIAMYGLGLGLRLLFFFLLVSYLCLLPVGIFCIAILRKSRTYTLPFYPFAVLGSAGVAVFLVL